MSSADLPKRQHVPLTRFHNATGEFLDMAMKAPIILTNHGRARQCIADAAYFDRLELIARNRILEAMAIEVAPSSAMPDAMRQRMLATQPSAEELANDRWNDEE